MIWKIAIGAGVLATAGYLYSLRKTSLELEAVSTGMIHKVDLSGVTVRVDVTLKNPTKNSFSIKYPFVKLMFRDKTIGTSDAINKDIDVPPYGQVRVEKIMIHMPLFGLLSVGIGLVKSFQDGNKVETILKTITTVDLGFKKIPFEKSETIVLKNAAA